MESPDEISHRPAERILKIVSELQDELSAKLNTDSERRLGEALAKAEMEAEERLQQAIADARKAIQIEVRNELKAEYEAKLNELRMANDELGRKSQKAAADWAAEREKLQSLAKAQARSLGPTEAQELNGRVAAAVRDEIKRIEAAVHEINGKLDDPNIELAAEIRLNRERAELASYLKGLKYSVGEVTV
jgi:hypothetical protein